MYSLNGKIIVASVAMIPMLSVAAHAQDNQAAIGYQSLNIRTDASSSSSVSFRLKKGDKVKILDQKNGWCKIEDSKKRVGWTYADGLVMNNSVKTNEKNPSNYIKTSAKVKISSNDSLNVRTGAGTNHKILAVLNNGDRVTVLSEKDGWSKVSLGNGTEGYVSSTYLVGVPDTKDGKKSIVEVTSSILNLRKSKSISSQNLKVLSKGQKVTALESDKDWTKIDADGVVGYVPTYFVQYVDDVVEEITDKTSSNANQQLNVSPGQTQNVNVGYSLSDMVSMQMASFNTITGGLAPSQSDLEYVLNPQNFTDGPDMMQFARLDEYKDSITAAELNRFLNKYTKPGDVFYNRGQDFINAARNNNINVLYLVAHSVIESGYGKSRLASGNPSNGVTVYNFFGIGAVDGNAFNGGINTAYKNNWTSVEATIDGSAKWIAKNYIHSTKYDQNTLYKMKFYYPNTKHQYASSIDWPRLIGQKMAEITSYSSVGDLNSYEIPVYN